MLDTFLKSDKEVANHQWITIIINYLEAWICDNISAGEVVAISSDEREQKYGKEDLNRAQRQLYQDFCQETITSWAEISIKKFYKKKDDTLTLIVTKTQ